MEYYSTTKKEWNPGIHSNIMLEDIMLIEKIQEQKVKLHMFSLIFGSFKEGDLIEVRSRTEDTRVREE